MYLIFDTETTGTKPGSRISQLAWTLYNNDGQAFKTCSVLIKPDGWHIPTVEELTAEGNKNPHFFEENGMSTERCEDEGKPIAKVLNTFLEAIEETEWLIAHNFAFDSRILAYEMGLLELQTVNKPKKFCTMLNTVKLCKIPNANGRSGFKWPKLAELHQFLFQCDFDGAHDAGFDVAATGKCFFHIIRNKLIQWPPQQ